MSRRRVEDNHLAWHPNGRAPVQVRIHRLDGVAVWSDHRSMRAAEEAAHSLMRGESLIAGPDYLGPNDLVEVVDTRTHGVRR